jgi:hypothetical protein
MAEDGKFIASGPGGEGVAVYEDRLAPFAWHAVFVPAGGKPRSRSHATLDAALLDLSISARDAAAFRVDLPGGASFQRPGKVPAEEVLGNLGFVLVRELDASFALALPGGISPQEARMRFEERLGSLAVNLRGVAPVEAEGGSVWWCGNVVLPVSCYVADGEYDALAAAYAAKLGIEFHPGVEVVAEAAPEGQGLMVLPFAG